MSDFSDDLVNRQAAAGCEMAAATIHTIGDALTSEGNPLGKEFTSLARDLVERAGEFWDAVGSAEGGES